MLEEIQKRILDAGEKGKRDWVLSATVLIPTWIFQIFEMAQIDYVPIPSRIGT